MSLIEKAHRFAAYAHEGQTRKYTGEPYIAHPVAVADLVADFYRIHRGETAPEEALAAALLHDVVEDTDVDIDNIHAEFGEVVAQYVWYLTKPPKILAKPQINAIYEVMLAHAPEEVRIVKFFDIKHNYAFLDEIDPKFWEKQRPKLYARIQAMRAEEIEGLVESESKLFKKLRGE